MEPVSRWMTKPAIVAPETMTLPDARNLLQTQRIRRIPVVDAASRLVGIVTEGDINRVSDSHVSDVRDYNLYYRVKDLPLAEIMTRAVFTVTPNTPVMEVARLMLEQRIGGIPVVEGEEIVGMITESDLFRMIVMQQSQQG